jgi:UDP-GlcNAc3NAcA epimerase
MILKVLSVVGARPQFVKAAMVASAVQTHNSGAPAPRRIRHRLLHTGQHYDRNLSDVFFDQLPLPKPHHVLGVGSGSHGAQTGAMLERIEVVLQQEKPDFLVAYGDTNSTLAGALAAAKLHIPVAHVEAGLRSYNRRMPEEINRVATDHLSDLLFCPTRSAIEHLHAEGIRKGVALTGDVMLDAVLRFAPLAQKKTLERLKLRPSEFCLVTVHRAENTDDPKMLAEIVAALAGISVPMVFPMHPRLRNRLASEKNYASLKKDLEQVPHLCIIDPVSYLEMLALESSARMVLTDSGGVQKEAYFLGVPCITLRNETEWTDTLAEGWNRVVPPQANRIVPLVRSLWSRNGASPSGKANLRAFGNGQAAEKIVKALVRHVKGKDA